MKKKAFQVAHSKVKFDSVPNKPTKKAHRKNMRNLYSYSPSSTSVCFQAKHLIGLQSPRSFREAVKMSTAVPPSLKESS